MNKVSKLFLYIIQFSVGLLTFPTALLAHVGYVLNESERIEHSGTDFSFLYRAFSNPANILLVLTTIAIISALYFLLRKSVFVAKYAALIESRAESYLELIPWMIRLGLGIALIGAGSGNVLISPILSGFSQFSFIQILLGFLLLSGFLLAPAILGVILLFLFALTKNFYLLGNIDFLALAVALFIIAEPKPGVDDLFRFPFLSPLKNLKKYIPLILRIGIGSAMMFLAVYEKFLNPHLSQLVVERYRLTSIIPVSTEMWVFSAGLIEFLMGFLLFVGFQTRLVSAIAFLVLTLSFFYFHEAVYSHITLFTLLSILFVTGGSWSKNMKGFLKEIKEFI